MTDEEKLNFRLDLDRIKHNLSPRDQLIFELWIEGYTLQEIANVIGQKFKKRNAIRPPTYRAIGARLQKIRERIQKKELL